MGCWELGKYTGRGRGFLLARLRVHGAPGRVLDRLPSGTADDLSD